jgi:8-oxo-dGTP pyrophosphatase MutT (NUDIX family)
VTSGAVSSGGHQPTRRRDAVSAGGVVFRRGDDGIEIVLVSRRSPTLFALPKGTPDTGETIEETAIREVREETGLQPVILDEIDVVRYSFMDGDGSRVDKLVHFFLMEAVGGDIADHDHEFDDVGWYHFAEAERLMTHRNQMHILHRASELIAQIR